MQREQKAKDEATAAEQDKRLKAEADRKLIEQNPPTEAAKPKKKNPIYVFETPYGAEKPFHRKIRAVSAERALAWAKKKGAPDNVRVKESNRTINLNPEHQAYEVKVTQKDGSTKYLYLRAATEDDLKRAVNLETSPEEKPVVSEFSGDVPEKKLGKRYASPLKGKDEPPPAPEPAKPAPKKPTPQPPAAEKPAPETSKVQDLADRVEGLDEDSLPRNNARVLKDLEDVSPEMTDLVEEYRDVDRTEFPDPEDFKNEKVDRWGAIQDEMANHVQELAEEDLPFATKPKAAPKAAPKVEPVREELPPSQELPPSEELPPPTSEGKQPSKPKGRAQAADLLTEKQNETWKTALAKERETNPRFQMTPAWLKKTLRLSDARIAAVYDRLVKQATGVSLTERKALVDTYGPRIEGHIKAGTLPKTGVRDWISSEFGIGKIKAQALMQEMMADHPEMANKPGRPRKPKSDTEPHPSSPENVKENPTFNIAHDGPNGEVQVDVFSQPTLEAALADAKQRGYKNPREHEIQKEPPGPQKGARVKGKRQGSRAEGRSPTQMGINRRKLNKLELTDTQEAALKLSITKAFKEAHEAGADSPSATALQKAWREAVGQKLTEKLFNDWYSPSGRSAMPWNEAFSAGWRAMWEKPSKEGIHPHVYHLGHFTSYRGAEHTVPIDVGLSDAASTRLMQYWRYGLMQAENPTTRQRIAQNLLAATPRHLQAKRAVEMRRIETWRTDVEKSGIMLSRRQIAELERLNFKELKQKFTAGDYADSFQQLAVLTTLYLKPSYLLPNLAGQLAILLNDHAWSPLSIHKTLHLTASTYKAYADR